jgi:hypothetical protein
MVADAFASSATGASRTHNALMTYLALYVNLDLLQVEASNTPLCPANRSVGCHERLNLTNSVSSVLDLSQLYGSSLDEQAEARAFEGGRLRTGRLGPEYTQLGNCSDGRACITQVEHLLAAGRGVIPALQTLFQKEHNRWAFILATLFPDWEE